MISQKIHKRFMLMAFNSYFFPYSTRSLLIGLSVSLMITESIQSFGQEKLVVKFGSPASFDDSIFRSENFVYKSSNSVLYRSYGTPAIFNLKALDIKDDTILIFEFAADVEINKLQAYNCTVGKLYQIAFYNKMIGQNNSSVYFNQYTRSKWELKDSSLLSITDSAYDDLQKQINWFAKKHTYEEKEKRNGWEVKNLFHYQIELPIAETKNNPYEKYQIMLYDLNKYFGDRYGVNGRMETQQVKCLSLVTTSKASKNKLATKKLVPEYKIEPGEFYAFRYSLSEVLNFLGNSYLIKSGMPLLNETEFSDDFKIDINLQGDISELKTINKQLQKFDLKLVPTNRKIKMIIIQQSNSQ